MIQNIPGVTKRDLWNVPFTSLVIIPDLNVRSEEHYGDIKGLAYQIIANGVSPMEVINDMDNRVIVKDGHRRHMAIEWAIEEKLMIANEIFIPCYTEPYDTSVEQRLIDMLAHADSESLNILDEAKAFHTLTEQGKSVDEISKMIGKKTLYIKQRLQLLKSPKDVLTAIKSGKISATAAIQLIKINPEKQKKIIKESTGKISLKDVKKKKKPDNANISRAYVDDLYEVVQGNYETQSDNTGRLIIAAIQSGITMCKDDKVDLQETITKLRSLF